MTDIIVGHISEKGLFHPEFTQMHNNLIEEKNVFLFSIILEYSDGCGAGMWFHPSNRPIHQVAIVNIPKACVRLLYEVEGNCLNLYVETGSTYHCGHRTPFSFHHSPSGEALVTKRQRAGQAWPRRWLVIEVGVMKGTAK